MVFALILMRMARLARLFCRCIGVVYLFKGTLLKRRSMDCVDSVFFSPSGGGVALSLLSLLTSGHHQFCFQHGAAFCALVFLFFVLLGSLVCVSSQTIRHRNLRVGGVLVLGCRYDNKDEDWSFDHNKRQCTDPAAMRSRQRRSKQ